jgi:ATP-dependent helicase HrpB
LAQLDLPINAVLPALKEALANGRNLVLHAPPGAGKSTGVPLALLQEPWLQDRRILLLEPRRLAARAVAARMATLLNEPIGARVGYRMRMDRKTSAATRIEVVTEGMLTRLLQNDPGLETVGLVIFDEFHERSLQADLGLALCLESQSALRDDLRLLVMSATLDTQAVAQLLGAAPIIASQGQAHPVVTHYLPRAERSRLETDVSAAIRRALRDENGDMLVFLPGVGEIKRVEQALHAAALDAHIDVLPLYGDLPPAAQDQAIQPSRPGRRKIVLATAIAETSLTIEGVRIVIDAGLARVSRFEPRSGMSRLDTIRVARASADQRRGRAGRLGPGTCYRLWSEAEQQRLIPAGAPEILEADLAPLALELARWGTQDPAALHWLDPPASANYAQARDLLHRLGALDHTGRITAHGHALAEFGLHPRLAHMLITAKAEGLGVLACRIAALLSERDILKGAQDADLRLRLDVLAAASDAHAPADRNTTRRVMQTARHYQQQLGVTDDSDFDSVAIGRLLAYAYPDRVARRRINSGDRYLMTSGKGAAFNGYQPLAADEFIVIADLDGRDREARIYLAAATDYATLTAQFADRIERAERIAWDSREQCVIARREERLDAMVIAESALAAPTSDQVLAAMLTGIREMGLAALPWNDAARMLQARVAFVKAHDAAAWPNLSDAGLYDTLDVWLSPWLAGISRRDHLHRLDMLAMLTSLLDWDRQQRLQALAPTHLTVPSGSHIPIDYLSGEIPILAVRLQELFGLTDTPRLAGGRVPVLIHLLSPARRPVQVTRDLASFWATTYHEVKKDLKGRYPKHHWPDDPLSAPATNRTKRVR